MKVDFEEVYSKYYCSVYRYLITITKDRNIADEMAQETFYKALKNIHTFNPELKMLTWLCQIAKNTYYSYCKKNKKLCELDENMIDNEEDIIEKVINSEQLLPLYIEEVVSKESNDFIEKHLQECKQCKEMLNLLKQEEQVSNIDEKEAIRKFHKKLRYKNLKTLIITLLCIIIILYIGWQLLYVNEYMVPYAENLANVEIPEDGGIDIKINTKNYKNGYAILVKTGENIYDVYVNITQNIITKLFKDNDQSNNLIRIGNNICIDFQSEKIRFFEPENAKIQNIYYINENYKDIVFLTDEELVKLEDKILLWSNNT